MAIPAAVLAAVSIGSAAVGTGVAIYGQQQQAAAQRNQYQYQAQIAANNALIARQNAESAIISGQQEEEARKAGTTKLIGAQKAAAAASNLDVSSGTEAAIQSSTQMEGDLDAAATHYNTLKKAYGYGISADDYLSQSAADKVAGDNAIVAGNIASLSSFIGGASSVSGKALGFQQAGVFSGTKPKMGGMGIMW